MYPSPIGQPTYVLKYVDKTKNKLDETRYSDIADGLITLNRIDTNNTL